MDANERAALVEKMQQAKTQFDAAKKHLREHNERAKNTSQWNPFRDRILAESMQKVFAEIENVTKTVGSDLTNELSQAIANGELKGKDLKLAQFILAENRSFKDLLEKGQEVLLYYPASDIPASQYDKQSKEESRAAPSGEYTIMPAPARIKSASKTPIPHHEPRTPSSTPAIPETVAANEPAMTQSSKERTDTVQSDSRSQLERGHDELNKLQATLKSTISRLKQLQYRMDKIAQLSTSDTAKLSLPHWQKALADAKQEFAINREAFEHQYQQVTQLQHYSQEKTSATMQENMKNMHSFREKLNNVATDFNIANTEMTASISPTTEPPTSRS